MRFTFIALIAILALALASEFPSQDFTIEEQNAALAFWEGKSFDNVPSMDLILDTGKETVEPVEPAGSPVPRNLYNTVPYKYAGRLFFETARGRSSCTASSIGGNAVLTAGHCVHDGSSAFYKNIIFVPQFFEGAAPFQRWPAVSVFTTQEWARSGGRGFARDVGVFKSSNQGGKSLEQTVGAAKPIFSINIGKPSISIGYPGNIGGGNAMIQAKANIEQGDNFNPPTVRLRSTKTFGASGGPCKNHFYFSF